MSIPIELQKQKYHFFDLNKLPHLKQCVSQRMILLSILLHLNVAKTLNQIEPKVYVADELKSGIVAQDEYIINLRPYFAQKMRGSCFSTI